jgi:hypothetical protein
MGLNYFASSPVLIPPSPSAFSQPSQKRYTPKYPQPPSLNYLARVSSGAAAGRKRSRDEDHDAEPDASSRPITVPEPKPEPVMGPGMTLIYPDEPSLNISAESQSGTWMEERAVQTPSTERPRLIARKSRCRIEDLPALPITVQDNQIDPLVRQLGIGWKRIPETQRSAIAGNETFIRKQFDLLNPHILLHHEGMGVYVVQSEPPSAPGYWTQFWLFRDNLRSCRFLCNDEEQLMQRLNHKRCDERGHWIPDIRYEGPEVLAKDVRPPPILDADVFVTAASVVYSGSDAMMSVEAPLAPAQQPVEDVEMEGVA